MLGIINLKSIIGQRYSIGFYSTDSMPHLRYDVHQEGFLRSAGTGLSICFKDVVILL